MSAAAPHDSAKNTGKNPPSSSFASAQPISQMPIPRTMGRRLLLRLLARGGMGDVYLAANTGLEGAERPCVVKTVRRDHIHDGSFLARFLDEARVQAQLNHPGVAQVIEAATDENGEPYTVVEYIEGRSLAEVRQRVAQLGHSLHWADAVAVAVEMLTALSHIHGRTGADGMPLGIVHRDLSPQNVMVGYAGEVKLIDFGTARGQNRKCHTVAGVVFAKPGYVAPEIARHEVGDGRIDMYAVGVMLWELCKGQRLLTGDPQKHLEEVARARFIVPKVCVGAQAAKMPAELDVHIAKLTANNPDERYAHAGIAASELAKLLALAPASKHGERSVRARIAALMGTLFPQEPSKSRAEFARLLAEAKATLPDSHTPPASGVMEVAAKQMAEDPSLLPGTPYRLIRKVGEGATGTVWEAEHIELDRKLAVKVIDVAHSSALDSIDRFRKEAKVIANLRHPNLAYLHDFGKALDGRVFLAMEFLEGETVARRISRRALALEPLNWREAVDIAIQATRALEAAHGAGIVHRDLKPENLFITDRSQVKLLDFGVALAKGDVPPTPEARTDEDDEDAVEEDGQRGGQRQRGFAVFGTPEYMAPEQVSGEAVDQRCDIYALGCVLYELVTGKRPFAGNSAIEIMGKQLREEPPPVCEVAASTPRRLADVIERAMKKAADERFASAEEMRDALEEVLRAPHKKQVKTRRTLTVAFTAALALVVTAGAVYRGRAHEAKVASAPIETVDVSELPLAVSGGPSGQPGSGAAGGDSNQVVVPDPGPAADGQPDLGQPGIVPAVPGMGSAAPAGPGPGQPGTMVGRTDASPGGRAGGGGLVPLPEPRTAAAAPPEDAERAEGRGSSEREERRGAGAALERAREDARARPRDAKALRAWTRAAIRAHALEEAKRAADAWVGYDPSSEPRIVQAQVMYSLGQRAEARAALAAYLKRNPVSDDAKRALARMDSASAHSREAREDRLQNANAHER